MTESIPLWKRVGIHKPKCCLASLDRPKDQNVNDANQPHPTICQENGQTTKCTCRCLEKSTKPQAIRRNTIQVFKIARKNLPLQRNTFSTDHQNDKYCQRLQQHDMVQDHLATSSKRHLRDQLVATDAEVQKLQSIKSTSCQNA